MSNNRECYLNHTNQCSGQLNNEHIISRTVIKNSRLEKITIPIHGKYISTHWEQFKSKILCEKHNRMFSICDEEAGRLVQFLMKNENSEIIIDGKLIEIWVAKTIANFFYGGFLNNIEKLQKLEQEYKKLHENIIEIIINMEVKNKYGMNFIINKNKNTNIPCESISFKFMHQYNKLVGTRLTLDSFSADFIFAENFPMDKNFDVNTDFRPSTWKIYENKTEKVIHFSWGTIPHSCFTVTSTVFTL